MDKTIEELHAVAQSHLRIVNLTKQKIELRFVQDTLLAAIVFGELLIYPGMLYPNASAVERRNVLNLVIGLLPSSFRLSSILMIDKHTPKRHGNAALVSDTDGSVCKFTDETLVEWLYGDLITE